MFTIHYQDKYKSLEDIATKSKFMLHKSLPYDSDASIEITFDSGLELINYIDNNKLLKDEELPFLSIVFLCYQLALKSSNLGL